MILVFDRVLFDLFAMFEKQLLNFSLKGKYLDTRERIIIIIIELQKNCPIRKNLQVEFLAANF